MPGMRAALLLLLFVPHLASRGARAQPAPPAPSAPVAIDHAGVNEAITSAVEWLYSQQMPDGTWERSPAPRPMESEDSRSEAVQSDTVGQWGGRTALVVYALLAAGEDPRSPRLEPAVTFIKSARMTGTYAVGIRLMALSYLPFDDDVRRVAEQDADLLLRSVKTQGDAAGHYDYNVTLRNENGLYSHSRSQYGLLGMWAAARMGYRVDPRYWQLVDAGWRRNQRPRGGWSYTAVESGPRAEETPGMTAAGVASLMITGEQLSGDRAACNGNVTDPNVEAGLAWLAANFDKLDPDADFRRQWTYITLYNLERLSVAGGLRYIGEHDWYGAGAGWLLRERRRDGSFRNDVIDTSFALVFLARGRSPLLAARLAHESTDARGNPQRPDWNQRPRDLANLADFTGRGLERELHWQILTPSRPVEEWLDAPILYLSGSAALNLADEVKAKLREYALHGGLIVFNADCGRRPFADSVMRLGRELFPEYDFRMLRPEHPVYNMQYPLSRGRRPPRIQALGNGVRELMILIPSDDAGREWQTRRDETALQLGANLYLYAVDTSGMRYKGDRHVVTKDASLRTNRNAAVGRLKHAGNWNPEPAGWERLAAVLHNGYDTTLNVRHVDPAAGDALHGLDVLHITGTDDFALDEPAREAIRAFVEHGGTLLIDAAGGSTAFAAAADRELRVLFPDSAGELNGALPPTHDLFAERPLHPPLEIAWRLDALRELGLDRAPRLRGIEIDGRLAIVYSPHDLSAGLVGHRVAGVIGYTPETATALVARIVLDAAQ